MRDIEYIDNIASPIGKMRLYKINFFILSLFLIPRGQNYRLYFAIVFILGIVSFFSLKKNEIKITKTFIFLCLGLLLFTLVRLFTLRISLEKDLTEIARLFLPTYLLIMSATFRGYTFENFLKILSYVVIIDFFIALMEFFIGYTYDWTIFQAVKNLYWSETHWVSRGRSKGLFSGPGQHAASTIFFFILYLTNYFFNKKSGKSLWNLLIIFLLAFSTFATLSRTGISCLVISLIIVIGLRFKNMSSKDFRSILFLVAIFTIGGGYFYKSNTDKLVRLTSYVDKGFSQNSLNDREYIWIELKEKAYAKSEYLLTGWGKSYFGESAAQTDNEYLFVILFYGLVFFIIFFGLTLYYILSYIMDKRAKTTPETALFVLICVGYIFAIPSAFFFYIQNLLLFSMVVILISNEKLNNQNKLISI